MVFSLSALWWRRIRGYGSFLMGETGWAGSWVLFWWLGPCSVNLSSNFLLMGGAVFPPAIYLGPNYGGGNEGNGDLLQRIWCMYCYTHCPQPCSRWPPTHISARDSWTLLGKSGSVSCGITAPFSWVLVCTRFCLCPQGFVCAHKVLFVTNLDSILKSRDITLPTRSV